MTIDTSGGVPARATVLVDALNWLYDKVAGDLHTPFHEGGRGDGCEQQIDRWIAMASVAAGTAGFATGVGGLFTLPIALPANVLGVATVQVRLIVGIAHCRGYDTASPEVRAMCLACLVGNGAMDVLKNAGVAVGEKLGLRAIGSISGAALTRVNQAVGFRLLTKAGSQGLVNLTKVVPVLGGVIGGTVDGFSTRAVGAIAKRVFPRVEPLSAPTGPTVDAEPVS